MNLEPTDLPYLEIHEQPKSNGLRFRYATEGEKAGSISGENSTPQHQTFPSVQLHNCRGLHGILAVSCVTATEPYRPHPHRLVGQDCIRGICKYSVKGSNNDIIPLTKVGIQCCRQKDIDKSLEERDVLGRDIFIGKGIHPQNTSFDLSTVRLCFLLFLYDGDRLKHFDTKISNPIIDKKAVADLVICRLSRTSGSVRGGDEVFLLCTGIKKDDIEVVFALPDGSWQANAEFLPSDVHKQFAIVFKTPPYQCLTITNPVDVEIYLRCPSKNVVSESKKFQYFAEDSDPFGIERKRKRTQGSFTQFVFDHNIPSSSCGAAVFQQVNTLAQPPFSTPLFPTAVPLNIVPSPPDHQQSTPPQQQSVPAAVFGNAVPSGSQLLWSLQTSTTVPSHISMPKSYDRQTTQPEIMTDPSCAPMFLTSQIFPDGGPSASFMPQPGMIHDPKSDVVLDTSDNAVSFPSDLASLDERELQKLLGIPEYDQNASAAEHRQTDVAESIMLNGVPLSETSAVMLNNPSYGEAVEADVPSQVMLPETFISISPQTERTNFDISLCSDANEFESILRELGKQLGN